MAGQDPLQRTVAGCGLLRTDPGPVHRRPVDLRGDRTARSDVPTAVAARHRADHNGPQLSQSDLDGLTARGIAIVDGTVAALEVDDDAIVGVRLDDGTLVACQALVVRARFVANSEVLTSLGLHVAAGQDDDRAFPTDANGVTEIPGVWAAGNVADAMLGVVGSAAAGFATGAAINADLVADDLARAREPQHAEA